MIYLCLTPGDFSETHFLISLTFPHVCLLWLKTFLSVKEVPALFLAPAPTPAVSCVSPCFQASVSLKTLSTWYGSGPPGLGGWPLDLQ